MYFYDLIKNEDVFDAFIILIASKYVTSILW